MPTVKDLRLQTGMTQAKFAAHFHMPVTSISAWEQGVRKPPEYVILMMERILRLEGRIV